MSLDSMIIDQPTTESNHTLFIRGHHVPASGLHEIDIIQGAPGCATTGRITGKEAYAVVNPNKYAQIKAHANPGVEIALIYTTNPVTHTKDITDVQCPRQSALFHIEAAAARLVVLEEQQVEFQREKARTDAALLEELRTISGSLSELVRLAQQRPSEVKELAGGAKKVGTLGSGM